MHCGTVTRYCLLINLKQFLVHHRSGNQEILLHLKWLRVKLFLISPLHIIRFTNKKFFLLIIFKSLIYFILFTNTKFRDENIQSPGNITSTVPHNVLPISMLLKGRVTCKMVRKRLNKILVKGFLMSLPKEISKLMALQLTSV